MDFSADKNRGPGFGRGRIGGFKSRAEYLDQDGVIDIAAERAFRASRSLVAIAGELPAGEIDRMDDPSQSIARTWIRLARGSLFTSDL